MIQNHLIDLHLHLDGSLPVDTFIKLAKSQGVSIPESREEVVKLLTLPPESRDLNDYLKCFDLPLSVMQTEEAVFTSVKELCESLKGQGLEYAEIRFAPQLHLQRGATQESIALAACEGVKASGFNAGIILCCMRGKDNFALNMETVKIAHATLKNGVVATDLAGAEALFPTSDYRPLFEYASSLGLAFTVHAGEADGPESVWAAVSFGTPRIGHGIRAISDPELLKIIKKKGIVLEVCPTSNLQTGAATAEDYPLMKYLEMEIPVTLNTDNMTVSGTTLKKEFEVAERMFGLTEEGKRMLIKTAKESIFS